MEQRVEQSLEQKVEQSLEQRVTQSLEQRVEQGSRMLEPSEGDDHEECGQKECGQWRVEQKVEQGSRMLEHSGGDEHGEQQKTVSECPLLSGLAGGYVPAPPSRRQ